MRTGRPTCWRNLPRPTHSIASSRLWSGWEREIAWAQARNRELGTFDWQAHESAVAEVGLM